MQGWHECKARRGKGFWGEGGGLAKPWWAGIGPAGGPAGEWVGRKVGWPWWGLDSTAGGGDHSMQQLA